MEQQVALSSDDIGCAADMAAHRIRCFELAVQLAGGSPDKALEIAEKLLELLYKVMPTREETPLEADRVVNFKDVAEPPFEAIYPAAEVSSRERLLVRSAVGRTKIWVTPIDAYQANR